MLKTNLSILVIGVLFFGVSPSLVHAETFKRHAVLMGTDIELTASETDQEKVTRAFDAAIAEMKRIENEMSEWKEESPVSEVNRMAGRKPAVVPEELFRVIAAGRQVSELSDGAFDISWAAMRGLWKFSPGSDVRVPSSGEIEEKIPLINYKNVVLDQSKHSVFLKKKGMAIGLGGIAKGYAVDAAMKLMVRMGVENAVIKAGGDIRVQGLDDGKPWEIGVQHPRDRDKLLGLLHLTDISISTSGDYEHFFIKNGTLYHHIIDPKTGYPARKCQSVTILAPDTTTSDALTKAVFVLGPEKGMALIRRLPGIQGIIVDSEGKATFSPGVEIGKGN